MNQCWNSLYDEPVVMEDGDDIKILTTRQSFKWMEQFKPVEKIANFGCWPRKNSSPGDQPPVYVTEPFGLLWTLEATHIDVVEMEKEQVMAARSYIEALKNEIPQCFSGRHIQVIHGDMTENILPPQEYDLAFSEHVIKKSDLDKLRAMADCVKVGGYVVVIVHGSVPMDSLAKEVPSLTVVSNIDKSLCLYSENTYVYRRE
ncbi:MAG: class I SAM-dependent methyltransferase [Caldilineaceae bacterium]